MTREPTISALEDAADWSGLDYVERQAMTQTAVTLHTLSERELDLTEDALKLAIELLEFGHALNWLRPTGPSGESQRGMRELLLKIQAAR